MTAEGSEGAVPPCPYEGKVPGVSGPPVEEAPKEVPALADPPRHVPLLVRCSNLLGGFYNQFGWLWLGLTGFFLWFFLPNVDVTGLYHFDFRGDLGTAPGVVVVSRDTNFSENDVDIYAHTYRFTGRDGAEREGVSYATGRRLEAGTNVTVEYVPDDPAISRIRQMRREPFGVEGWGGLISLGVLSVFTVIGMVILVTGVRKGMKANRLLASGRLALGRLKGRRPTSTSINERPVWEFTFEFQGEDLRPHQAKARTHKVARLADPRGEFLLYDPLDPAYAVLLDNIPGAVRTNDLGQLETDRPRKAVASLLVPAVMLSAHGVVAYIVLL